ncbi:hypothetical protein F7P69_06140 [Cellulosimicrobium funkei]|nr:hypothetical protein [Cellulosimicrobium funkei]
MNPTSSPRGTRRRRVSVAALVLAAGFVLLGAITPQQTDAAWISEEAGTVAATAGTVAPPVTTCEGRNSRPNLLHLTPAEDGLPVSGYLVTVTVGDGDDADEVDDEVPAGWQTGHDADGNPLLPANTPTYVPAANSVVAWGITGGWSYTWKGTVTVSAVGPGGWASSDTSYDWTLGFDFLGNGYGSCT